MKLYQDVVRERYDGREREVHIYDNQYSLINPIGYYGTSNIRDIFYKIFNVLRKENLDIGSLKILDVGCGTGGWTRYFAELIGSTENIYGIDLSRHRIEIAQKMNPNIKYKVEDVVDLSYSKEFDIITAIDVLTHINTEEQIISALCGIYDSLKPNGFFIWYDVYAKDHFQSQENDEAQGYHPAQMIELCRRCSFKKFISIPMFKNIWGYHTLYLAKRLPTWLVSLIEKFPGPPGNVVMMFRK